MGEGSLKDQFSTYYINGVPHVGEKVIDGPLTDSDHTFVLFQFNQGKAVDQISFNFDQGEMWRWPLRQNQTSVRWSSG